jgi:hypothetical protein
MYKLSGSLLLFTLISVRTLMAVEPSPLAQLPAGDMQEKATAACASCHEARIILQQRLSRAVWTKEMDKMIKWGAEVDAKDRDSLIEYFSTNFGPEQAAYVAPRTSEKATGKAPPKAKH